MKNRFLKRFWHSRRGRNKSSEEQTLFQNLWEKIRDKATTALAILVVGLVGSALTLLFIYLGGDVYLRKYHILKTEAETTQQVVFEGVLYQLADEKAIPLTNITVAIEGVDDFAEVTDEEGWFRMKARLPLGQKAVNLRFIDQDNRLIHEEKAAVILNEIDIDSPVRYVVHEANSSIPL